MLGAGGDQGRENMTRSRTRSPRSRDSHNQLATRPEALSKPATMKANRHPPQSASTATASSALTARARPCNKGMEGYRD